MIIKKATKKDVPIIWKMSRELAAYERLPGECTITKAATARIFFGNSACGECYLIEHKGKIIGMGKLLKVMETWTGNPFFLLRDFFIREEYRGKGYGERFMKFVMKLAHTRGYGCIQWNVFSWNKPTIKFYKKIGASTMKTTRMRVDGNVIARSAKKSKFK